jgi:hypothetical protein
MRKLLLYGIIAVLFFTAQLFGEEGAAKEKDIYALSYLCGYKCYRAISGKVISQLQYRNFVVDAYKSGFTEALLFDLNESAFEQGFQDAKNNSPSKYKEDIIKEYIK